MWLEKLIVVNYRSCKYIAYCLSKNNPNILIGINDCGKSSILHAIGLLLSQKPKFNFASEDSRKSDFSNSPIPMEEFGQHMAELGIPAPNYDDSQTIVIGKFVLEDADKKDEVIQGCSNHLQFAVDNLGNNSVWLSRVFDSVTCGFKDYLLTPDAVENDRPLALYNSTAKALQEIVKARDISKEDIENSNRVGRFKNNELVSAIYKNERLTPVWVEYSLKGDMALFPKYEYLDWNISMSDLQKFASDVVSERINDHVQAAAEFARERASEAQRVIDVAFSDFTSNFAEDIPNIQAFKANIAMEVETKVTDILVNKRNCDGDIHLDSQGDGVKRQIWFALIKWSAAQAAIDDNERKKFIWCFDEPETPLYPKAQRELFQIIKNVACQHTQVVISTHSTIFIDRADFHEISRFSLQDGYSQYSNCESVSDVYSALRIRNSDFLFYDSFLVVEGDTEEVLIPYLFEKCFGESLSERGVQLIKLNGKDNRHQHRLIFDEMLRNFNKPTESVIYLFDNDIVFEMTAAERTEYPFFSVGRQDIEDSISSDVWSSLIADQFAELDISFSPTEVDKIREGIPDDRKIENSQKFYSRLKAELIRKVGEGSFQAVNDRFPEKGDALGKLLCSHIESIDVVDPNIRLAFERVVTNS